MSKICVALVKDLRLLWPFAAMTSGLIVLAAVYDLSTSPLGGLLPIASMLASALFMLALVQQDPPASLRHDWLTRPVGGFEILCAKALLALGVIVAPGAFAAGVAAALDGGSVSEALLSALASTSTQLFLGLCLLMIGAVTSSLLEAAEVLIGLFVLFVLFPPIVLRLSGMSEAVLFLGSGWVVKVLVGLIVLGGGLAVIRLAYYRRRTVAARATFGATVALIPLMLSAVSWDSVAAVQRLTNNASVPRAFAIALAPGCFEARTLDPPSDTAAASMVEGPWSAEQRTEAGFGAVGFFTDLRASGLPTGWRMAIGHVDGSAIDPDGYEIMAMAPIRFTPTWRVAGDGQLEARHPWLVPQAALEKATKSHARLRFHYDLTLLAPRQRAALPLDGHRHAVAGLGSCTATAKSSAVIEVTCFVSGRQPDLLAARAAGTPQHLEIASGYPDFAPDLLQVTSGQQHRIMLASAPDGARQIIVTAYEAQASLAGNVTAPGLPAGPVTACPPDPGRRESARPETEFRRSQ